MDLVKNKLVSDIDHNVKLAQSSNFSIMEIRKTLDAAGYADIVKISYDLVFNKDGGIDDDALSSKYLEQLKQANGKIVISDIFFKDELPMISIVVPRDGAGGDIFFVDLSSVQQTLQDSAVDGSFVELSDANGNILFSNKQAGDLIPVPSSFDVGGKQ